MTQSRPITSLCGHIDRAEIMSMRTSFGTQVELMRTSYRTQTFPKHTHEFFTVGVMLEGAGTLWYRGANRVTHRGDVIVIPPGEVHTGGVARDAGILSYLAVHVPPETFAACVGEDDPRGGKIPNFLSTVIQDARIAAQLRRLDVAMCGDDARPADSALITALGSLVERHAERSQLSGAMVPIDEPRLVRITREVLEDCYADNSQTSLCALALRTGVTPFHVVRVFTRTTGLSPHQYLVQIRIRRAAKLLAGGVRASFVAAMTGFADQSHLTTQFKRYVGITPASYQRCMHVRQRL